MGAGSASSRPAGVPTRDRAAQLGGLLELLAGEVPDLRRSWRVQLVVADGSACPAGLPPRLTAAVDEAVVVPVGGGVSAGRNAVLDAARGDVLVYVDDDVRPHPGSLGRLAAAVRPDTVVAASVRGLGHRPGEASGLMRVGRHGFGLPVRPGQRPDYAVSALLGVPREVYRRVRWDERFAAAHLDDVMYGLRLRKAGVRLAHCADAVAEHPVRDDNDAPHLAGHRALVVRARWSGPAAGLVWLRCLASVTWAHRRDRRDVSVAVRRYLRASLRGELTP
jgi:GT2 family glycosyltransferase